MSPLLLLLAAGPAAAGGMHAGIPLAAQPRLGPVEPLSQTAGISAPVQDEDGVGVGVVRLYVSPTLAGAAAWLEQNVAAVQRPMVPLVLGDRALFLEDHTAAFVDGNVAVTVALSPDALTAGLDAVELAEDLHAAIVDVPEPWPRAPIMGQRDDGLWVFDLPQDSIVRFVGGRQPLGEVDGFSERPERVVAWDATGRASVLDVVD